MNRFSKQMRFGRRKFRKKEEEMRREIYAMEEASHFCLKGRTADFQLYIYIYTHTHTHIL